MMRAALRAFFAALLLAASCGAFAQSTLLPLGDLEARLKLTPAQKAQFDAAAAVSQRALFSIGLAALQMKVRIATELAKDRPDTDAILREQDAAAALVRPQFEEARAEWTKLYGMLSTEQAAVAREYVDRQLKTLEAAAGDILRLLREKMGEKLRP
jgi:hypothetical protein